MSKIYTENTIGIRKTTELEYNAAMVEKMKASVDYIAMMTDVELPEAENNTEEQSDD